MNTAEVLEYPADAARAQREAAASDGRDDRIGKVIPRRKKKAFTHGHARRNRTRTYSSWSSMMDRCEWGCNKPMYVKYGAKGIRVCERWHSFENFLADMGARPKDTSIDRIDNSKGYEPGNCRWATITEQNLNTSRTRWVTFKGERVRVYDLCIQFGIPRRLVTSKAQKRGYDYAAALRTYGIECEP